MPLVAAVLTILVAGQPMVVTQGFVDPAYCPNRPHHKTVALPRMEDNARRPITYQIECGH